MLSGLPRSGLPPAVPIDAESIGGGRLRPRLPLTPRRRWRICPASRPIKRRKPYGGRLRRRNPEFQGVISYDIQDGHLVGCKIVGGGAAGPSPSLALTELRSLDYEALDPQRDAATLREMTGLNTINGDEAATFRLAYPPYKPTGGVDGLWRKRVAALSPETRATIVIPETQRAKPQLQGRDRHQHRRWWCDIIQHHRRRHDHRPFPTPRA